MSNAPKDAKPWRNYKKEYEGMPLYLRRPDFINLEEIEHRFPDLVVATHHLTSVSSKGLPESGYNRSLADFDQEIVNFCERSGEGVIVLVETFSGKRAYYFYVMVQFSMNEMECHFRAAYPQHELKWFRKKDPEAKFIREYMADFC